MKRCLMCGEEKEESEFSKKLDGLTSWCKYCLNKTRREANQLPEFKEKNRIRRKKWVQEHPDQIKKERNKYNSSDGGKLTKLNSKLKTKYGITVREYEELLKKQEGRCAICGKPESELNKKLHIDHDHAKNKGDAGFIRGLLCSDCNCLLGFAKDSEDILGKSIEYLRRGHG